MIVCHCRKVCDRDVRDVVRAGARTRREVGVACGAGTGCGGCHPAIDELIDESAGDSRVSMPALRKAG